MRWVGGFVALSALAIATAPASAQPSDDTPPDGRDNKAVVPAPSTPAAGDPAGPDGAPERGAPVTPIAPPSAPAPTAESAPPPQPVGPAPEDFGQMGTTYRAHTGLLLRGYTGFGFMNSSVQSEDVKTDVGGGATSLGLTAGYSLRPRLAVHFDVVLNLMQGPEVTIDGTKMGSASGGLIGAGPGVSYYLPAKVNAYLAGSLLLFDRFIQRNDERFRNTSAGFGGNFVFGKEWWLGGSTGLGIVGQAFLGYNKDKATDDTWSTWAFTLNFSATYN